MSHFEVDLREVELKLKQPFGIARGTKDRVRNIFLRLQADGITGFGEAGPNSRYDEDAANTLDYLQAIPEGFLDTITDEEGLVTELDRFDATLQQPVKAGRAALEMAWLDWFGKKRGEPLWKLWSFTTSPAPVTSYTIGLDDIRVMRQKVREASDYPVLKVKLGTDRDRQIIEGIREETDKPIRVDANEGWSSRQEAREMIRFLAGQNVELVEQPLPSDLNHLMPQLKEESPLPLAADESFMGNESLEEIARAFDIINIKLMKIGSMVRASKVIEGARELGLKVMIGCMIESSLANTAGAILALRADYADLDGHFLIKDDPARGLWLDDDKRIQVPDSPGLGVDLAWPVSGV